MKKWDKYVELRGFFKATKRLVGIRLGINKDKGNETK